MENLIELVAASLARHGVECPSDSRLRTAASAPERKAAVASIRGNSEVAIPGSPEPTFTGLPDHNYRKSMQGDPAP